MSRRKSSVQLQADRLARKVLERLLLKCIRNASTVRLNGELTLDSRTCVRLAALEEERRGLR